jgi:predicted Zn-dependent protease
MIGKEPWISFLKKAVRESPADQTEAILLTEDSSLTRFTQSAIHQHVAERNGTLILRVVFGKKIAVVTTNALNLPSLRDSLQKAISLAKIQHPNEGFISLPGPKPIPEVDTFSKKIDRLTPDKKVKVIKDLFTIVKEKGLQVSGAFSHGKVELAIINSLGVEAYQRYSDLFFHLIAQNEKCSGYGGILTNSISILWPKRQSKKHHRENRFRSNQESMRSF